VAATADPDVVYGLCTLDVAGQVLDKAAFTALGWGREHSCR
jgi:hypothetical protein